MAQIPVSIGIPALVMRKKSHLVMMISESRLELVRRVPYIVAFVGLVIVNFAYLSAGPFVGLRDGRFFGRIALWVAFVLAFSFLVIGKRVWLDKEQMAQASVVFLPEWTYGIVLAVLINVVLTAT